MANLSVRLDRLEWWVAGGGSGNEYYTIHSLNAHQIRQLLVLGWPGSARYYSMQTPMWRGPFIGHLCHQVGPLKTLIALRAICHGFSSILSYSCISCNIDNVIELLNSWWIKRLHWVRPMKLPVCQEASCNDFADVTIHVPWGHSSKVLRTVGCTYYIEILTSGASALKLQQPPHQAFKSYLHICQPVMQREDKKY